jgi:hypothetical protein
VVRLAFIELDSCIFQEQFLCLFNLCLAGNVQKVRKEITLTTEQLQKLVRTYEIKEGLEMKISFENEKLFTQLTGYPPFKLFAESELSFFLKIVDAQVQFEKSDNGEITHLFLFQNGNKTEARRKK